MATVSHQVEYSFEGEATIAEVVASLQANEYFLLQAAKVLEICVPGLAVERAEVRIREVSHRSPLKELFALALLVTYQEELKKEVPPLVENFLGVEISDKYDTLVTVIVMLIAVYGISKIYDKIFPGVKPKNLSEDYARMINVAGNYINVTPTAVEHAIERTAGGKEAPRIESFSRRFFKPLLGKSGASVRSGSTELVSPGSIKEIPSEIQEVIAEPEMQTQSEMHRDVKIVLHATDKDKSKSGWAGHISGVFKNRIPMILDKNISASELFGRKQASGNVLVVYDRASPDDEYTPREFVLLSLSVPIKKKSKSTRKKK